MSEVAGAYQPGVCNINTAEIAKRRKIGNTGLFISIIMLVVLLILSISRFYRIILFLPLIVSASGYLQARNHFCVGYASAGMQNAEETSKEASRVDSKKAREEDKRRARVMNLQSASIAALLTVIAIVLPHI